MDLFNNAFNTQLSSQASDDFWQIDSYMREQKQKPILIDIVTPQPKSQSQFYNRTKHLARSSRTTQRIGRKRSKLSKKV